MTEIKIRKAPIDKLTNDVIRGLGDTGIFECKYECPADKIREDIREKLGAKYLEWTE